jgi:hypothetical protein
LTIYDLPVAHRNVLREDAIAELLDVLRSINQQPLQTESHAKPLVSINLVPNVCMDNG